MDNSIHKSIGVSNFEVPHLEQVFSVAKYKPAVNQVSLMVIEEPNLSLPNYSCINCRFSSIHTF